MTGDIAKSRAPPDPLAAKQSFLPKYSSDLNPNEQVLTKLTRLLREAAASARAIIFTANSLNMFRHNPKLATPARQIFLAVVTSPPGFTRYPERVSGVGSESLLF